MRKKLSIILLIIGMSIASYPLMEQGYSWYWQQKLFAQLEEPVMVDQLELELGQLETFEIEENNQSTSLTPQGEVLGILMIDTIKVKLPIIMGLNETNLKIGIAFLEETPFFGEDGNSVLAGHRGRSYGRLLNRLNEVELEDKIVISTQNGDYNYRVFNKSIVKPEEIEILRSGKEGEILSIVTCHPVRNPTHRLVVQAKIEQ